MNQILITNNINNKKNKVKKFFIKILFKIQLFLSLIIILILILLLIITFIITKKAETQNKKLSNNYNVYKLYNKNYSVNKRKNSFDNTFLGTIEIKKINLCYPVFSTLTEENLALSPCKFFGPSLGKNGNICIAGHNYDNNKFFSNLNKLNINDNINIIDNSGKKYVYKIFKIYEVKENELFPVYNYEKDSQEITLFTCNNINKNRLVIKAKVN